MVKLKDIVYMFSGVVGLEIKTKSGSDKAFVDFSKYQKTKYDIIKFINKVTSLKDLYEFRVETIYYSEFLETYIIRLREYLK